MPEIPADIGYSDRVRRDEDVGISDVDTAVRDLGLSTQGSFVWISKKYVNISLDTWADKITGLK